MAFSKFLSLAFLDNRTSQVFQRIKLILEEITNKRLIDGNLLLGVSLVTGVDNIVTHKLGRPIVGYLITQKSADCRIWDNQLTNEQKDKFLNLETSANVTVDIWVF
jgi:hypothetical protein